MRLDGELEQEESDMYIQLLVWFIQGLRKMGNLTVEQEAKVINIVLYQSSSKDSSMRFYSC